MRILIESDQRIKSISIEFEDSEDEPKVVMSNKSSPSLKSAVTNKGNELPDTSVVSKSTAVMATPVIPPAGGDRESSIDSTFANVSL